VGLLAGLLTALLAVALVPAAAQSPRHAALIVDFGDGRVVVRVVAFSGDTISGVELLQQSGLDVAVLVNLGGGAALCAVEGVGCAPTPQECFCQCRGTPCRYWSYFHLQDGAWVYAGMGAANHSLAAGDVDGWVWGDGSTPPPLLTWEQIWAASAPAPTTSLPTPLPSTTPVPAATAPMRPTAVPTEPASTFVPASLSAPTVPAAPSLTRGPVATAVPAFPAATGGSTPLETLPTPLGSPASAPAAEVGGIPWGGLLAFGGLVLVLAALGLWVRRRRS
jgi:hypothetical protein